MSKKTWSRLALGATFAAVIALGIVNVSAAVTFHSGPTASINSSKQLVVFFDASGLGNTSSIDVTVTADVTGCARCKNHGNQLPNAANKFDDNIISATVSCDVHNGRTRCTITLTPTAGLDCPGNQEPTIIGVQYADIRLSSNYFDDQLLGTKSAGILECTP